MKKIYFVVSYNPETNVLDTEIPKFAPMIFSDELFNETGDGWQGIISNEDQELLDQSLDIFNSKVVN